MIQRTNNQQRHRFYVRHIRGETYLEIAECEKVSKECVRYWCRRQRDGGSCQSQYSHAAGGYLHRFDPKVRYCVLRLRLEHPRWGPNRILMRMKKRLSLRGLRLPSQSSIGRYLHQWERFHRRRKFEVKRERLKPARRVHQRWQIDFKLEIPLADGSLVNLCTIRDPIGEACIGAFVFPAGKRKPGKRVTLEQLRSALRVCFARWRTLPEEIQTDNETVFAGSPWDPFPSRFTLWLTGLGITHILIRPGRPTDNAEVERCHRTIHEYAIIGNEDAHLAGLQAILDEAVEELCFQLPSRAEGCQHWPPIQAHPQLLQPRRTFQADHELALFDLQAVEAHLAHFTWQRKVGKNGQITMSGAHEYYSVGRAYARQNILVRFDPLDRHFVFFLPDDPEREIGRRLARNLDIADLTGIDVWPIGVGFQQLLLPLPIFQGVNC